MRKKDIRFVTSNILPATAPDPKNQYNEQIKLYINSPGFRGTFKRYLESLSHI